MPEHVLVVGREEGMARRCREHRPGTTVSVICRVEHMSRVRSPGQCARVLALPAEADMDEWIDHARDLHAAHPITRIALFGEQDCDRAAAIGEALGLTMHGTDTVRWVQDKHAMRARLRATGFEDTPAALVMDGAMLRSFADEHGLPLVIKPNGGTASVGISVARTLGELDACFAKAVAEHGAFRARGVLAERFYEGPQFSIESFSEDGEHAFLTIIRKYSDPLSFVEFGQLVPAPLGTDEARLIQRYATDLLNALGVRFGPTHTEFVLTSQGPRIIETHLRMCSDLYPVMPVITGVDLAGMQVRQTMGERVLPEIRRLLGSAPEPRYGAAWYAASDLRGSLVKIVGMDKTGPDSGVTITPLAEPGARLDGLHSNYSRLAEAWALASSPERALELAQEAIKGLRVVVHAPAVSPACF